jgi:hypothetical protein
LLILCCSKIDSFRKYEAGGPIVYTNMPDSLQVLPGNNRVGIAAMMNDPKVTEVKIYWANQADSAVFPVKVIAGTIDTFYVTGLPEGIASFEVVSYDKAGHSSVPANITGNVYGPNYSKGLLNRGITLVNWLASDSVDINWSVPDTINTTTTLYYTSTGGEAKQVSVRPDSTHTLLTDLDPAQPSWYRSYYMPVSNSVDTFPVAASDSLSKAKADVTQLYLKNARFPLVPTPESGTDRFRNLADWITTPNVYNAPGGFGGWADDFGTSIAVQVGWDGQAPVTDGKIYQTVTLPAGLYSFVTSPLPRKDGIGGCVIYVVAAEGATMPNTADVPAQSLGYRQLYDEQPMVFQLTKPTTVSLGFVFTMPDGNYLEFNVNVLQLTRQ